MAERSSLEVVQEALEKAPSRGFGETVELTVNLKDLDLTVPKNRIEDDMPLPNGRGKPVKVALFGTPEMCQKVKGVVDLAVSSAELDDVIKDKKSAKRLVNQMDFFLAEAPLMPTIGKRLGVVLGPGGRCPGRSLRAGTPPTLSTA